MFNWDDILIVGDSYCSSRHEPFDWPVLLLKLLTGEKVEGRIPKGEGSAGSAWWTSRSRLLNDLKIKVPKVLLLFHTEANRIPNDFGCGINQMAVELNRLAIPKNHEFIRADLTKASELYYKFLFSEEFHRWTQIQWFKELDTLITELNIPHVIHFHCFHNDYVFKTGITSSEVLFKMTEKNYDNSLSEWHQFRNHMTKEENISFANTINKEMRNSTIRSGKLFLDLLGNI